MGVKNSNLNSLRFPQNATQASLFRQIFFYTVSLLYYFLSFFIMCNDELNKHLDQYSALIHFMKFLYSVIDQEIINFTRQKYTAGL